MDYVTVKPIENNKYLVTIKDKTKKLSFIDLYKFYKNNYKKYTFDGIITTAGDIPQLIGIKGRGFFDGRLAPTSVEFISSKNYNNWYFYNALRVKHEDNTFSYKKEIKDIEDIKGLKYINIAGTVNVFGDKLTFFPYIPLKYKHNTNTNIPLIECIFISDMLSIITISLDRFIDEYKTWYRTWSKIVPLIQDKFNINTGNIWFIDNNTVGIKFIGVASTKQIQIFELSTEQDIQFNKSIHLRNELLSNNPHGLDYTIDSSGTLTNLYYKNDRYMSDIEHIYIPIQVKYIKNKSIYIKSRKPIYLHFPTGLQKLDKDFIRGNTTTFTNITFCIDYKPSPEMELQYLHAFHKMEHPNIGSLHSNVLVFYNYWSLARTYSFYTRIEPFKDNYKVLDQLSNILTTFTAQDYTVLHNFFSYYIKLPQKEIPLKKYIIQEHTELLHKIAVSDMYNRQYYINSLFTQTLPFYNKKPIDFTSTATAFVMLPLYYNRKTIKRYLNTSIVCYNEDENKLFLYTLYEVFLNTPYADYYRKCIFQQNQYIHSLLTLKDIEREINLLDGLSKLFIEQSNNEEFIPREKYVDFNNLPAYVYSGGYVNG